MGASCFIRSKKCHWSAVPIRSPPSHPDHLPDSVHHPGLWLQWCAKSMLKPDRPLLPPRIGNIVCMGTLSLPHPCQSGRQPGEAGRARWAPDDRSACCHSQRLKWHADHSTWSRQLGGVHVIRHSWPAVLHTKHEVLIYKDKDMQRREIGDCDVAHQSWTPLGRHQW